MQQYICNCCGDEALYEDIKHRNTKCYWEKDKEYWISNCGLKVHLKYKNIKSLLKSGFNNCPKCCHPIGDKVKKIAENLIEYNKAIKIATDANEGNINSEEVKSLIIMKESFLSKIG